MAQGPLPGKAAAEEHAVGTLTETSVEMGRYIGSRMLRKEDGLLVTGHGHFLDDLVLPGMVWMAMVRSPMAHARIARVDTSPAWPVTRSPWWSPTPASTRSTPPRRSRLTTRSSRS